MAQTSGKSVVTTASSAMVLEGDRDGLKTRECDTSSGGPEDDGAQEASAQALEATRVTKGAVSCILREEAGDCGSSTGLEGSPPPEDDSVRTSGVQLRVDLALEGLPSAVEFHDSSFFQRVDADGSKLSLPRMAEVRARNLDQQYGTVTFPDIGVFVKYGAVDKVRIEEARTLRSLRQAYPKGEVPVPELFAWRVEDGLNYIYMSFEPGSTLESVWENLSEENKEAITSQVREIVQRLRSIAQDPAKQLICAVDGGPVQDIWFPTEPRPGPFATSTDFNDWVQFWPTDWVPLSERRPDPFRHLLPDDAAVCFTHADLHLQNILVSDDQESRCVVAIVDWGQAGWYPEYWEYCKATLMTADHEWCKDGWLMQTMLPYDEELDAVAYYWNCRPP